MTSREYVISLSVTELRDILGGDVVATLTTLAALDHAIDVAVAVLARDEDAAGTIPRLQAALDTLRSERDQHQQRCNELAAQVMELQAERDGGAS